MLNNSKYQPHLDLLNIKSCHYIACRVLSCNS